MRRIVVSIVALMLATGRATTGLSETGGPARGASSLDGLWTSSSLTQLERPATFRSLTVTEREAKDYEARRPGEFMATEVDDVGGRAANSLWWDMRQSLARIDGQPRTSWIVEPANGRIPYSASGIAARQRRVASMDDASGPEARAPVERCLSPAWGAAGPPMLNAPYSNLYQIVQTPNDVAILLEANHEVRTIRLRGGHGPAQIRPWMGDSVGHWEGRTLVAETTNFNPGDAFRPPIGLYISPEATVTERFTPAGRDELIYEFTVNDPATFTQPWRGQMVFRRAAGPMLEYACHEGNYSLSGILAGARQGEGVTQARQATGQR